MMKGIFAAARHSILVNQITFQCNDLQRRELVGKTNDIQGIRNTIHHIERYRIHDNNARIVAFHISIGHDHRIVIRARKRLGNRSPVGSPANRLITCDV